MQAHARARTHMNPSTRAREQLHSMAAGMLLHCATACDVRALARVSTRQAGSLSRVEGREGEKERGRERERERPERERERG